MKEMVEKNPLGLRVEARDQGETMEKDFSKVEQRLKCQLDMIFSWVSILSEFG